MLLPLLINLRMFDPPIAEDVDGFKPDKNEERRKEMQKRVKEQDEEIIEFIKHFVQCL